jgi:aryl-alcohol dehydrogenase-like predicted oxidoreductase
MQKRRLGALEVSAVGLGCATMTPFYDDPAMSAPNGRITYNCR